MQLECLFFNLFSKDYFVIDKVEDTTADTIK